MLEYKTIDLKTRYGDIKIIITSQKSLDVTFEKLIVDNSEYGPGTMQLMDYGNGLDVTLTGKLKIENNSVPPLVKRYIRDVIIGNTYEYYVRNPKVFSSANRICKLNEIERLDNLLLCRDRWTVPRISSIMMDLVEKIESRIEELELSGSSIYIPRSDRELGLPDGLVDKKDLSDLPNEETEKKITSKEMKQRAQDVTKKIELDLIQEELPKKVPTVNNQIAAQRRQVPVVISRKLAR